MRKIKVYLSPAAMKEEEKYLSFKPYQSYIFKSILNTEGILEYSAIQRGRNCYYFFFIDKDESVVKKINQHPKLCAKKSWIGLYSLKTLNCNCFT